MNIISVFDGMSCAQIALNNLGIKYDNYFASEICPHGIKVTQSNYPSTKQIGDVSKVNASDLPHMTLLCGGSPCQGFSLLGDRLAFDDDRSKLFFEFVRLKKELTPQYFFLENVVMGKKYQDLISDILGVEPILINSSCAVPQSRKRLYWTNLKFTPIRTKRVNLKSVLASNFDDKYLLKDGRLNWLLGENGQKCLRKKYCSLDPEIAQCLTKRSEPSWNCNYITTEKGIRVLTPVECERLQGVPDNYTSCVDDKYRYEMLGNGWTIPIIERFFMNLESKQNLRSRSMSLFSIS